MKKNKGTIIIIVSLIFTGLLWWFATPKEDLIFLDQLSHALAGVSLVGLAWVFLLSTRHQGVNQLFGGLEIAYKNHKWLAIISVILVFVHARMSETAEEAIAIGEVVKSTSALIGTLGQFAFILLTLLALFGKKLKYEHWRFFHRLMVLPYLFGVYHTYMSTKYELFTFTPLALWVGITSLLGLIAGVYTIFFYQKTGFKYHGSVTNIAYLNKDIMEIELTFTQAIPYINGQYIFLKVFQKGLEEAPHPYSIAKGEGNKLYLSIKKLGDGTTDLYHQLLVGTKVKADGSYGHLNFDQGGDKQVWIAGGIGITPFISYIQAGAMNQVIDLYYTFRGEEASVYKEFLEKAQQENKGLTVHFHDTVKTDRLKIADIDLSNQPTVYICGPEKMTQNFIDETKASQPGIKINYEAFGFAR